MVIVLNRPHVDDRVTDLLWMVRVAPGCSPQTAARHAGKELEVFLADNQLLHVKLDNEPRGLLWDIYARQSRITLVADRDIAFDTALLAVSYAMAADGIALADIAMFADELADGRRVMPCDAAIDDGFGYYLKLGADDLADPAIGLFRSFLIGRFAALEAPVRQALG